MLQKSAGREILGGIEMQFIFDNDVYKVARITGPEHNLLGIRLASSRKNIDVVPLPMKNGDRVRIDKGSVLAQIERGLLNVNFRLKKDYIISEVLFLPSDSPSDSVYEYLIFELIKRIDEEGDFLIV